MLRSPRIRLAALALLGGLGWVLLFRSPREREADSWASSAAGFRVELCLGSFDRAKSLHPPLDEALVVEVGLHELRMWEITGGKALGTEWGCNRATSIPVDWESFSSTMQAAMALRASSLDVGKAGRRGNSNPRWSALLLAPDRRVSLAVLQTLLSRGIGPTDTPSTMLVCRSPTVSSDVLMLGDLRLLPFRVVSDVDVAAGAHARLTPAGYAEVLAGPASVPRTIGECGESGLEVIGGAEFLVGELRSRESGAAATCAVLLPAELSLGAECLAGLLRLVVRTGQGIDLAVDLVGR